MNFYTTQLLKEIGFKKFFLLAILSIFASIFELMGIGSIGPFINLINDPSYLSNNQILNNLSNMLTIKNDENFFDLFWDFNCFHFYSNKFLQSMVILFTK